MYIINKISPSGSGDRLLLLIATPEGETETFSIRCDVYRRLALKKGEISDDTYNKIVYESVRGDALAKGLNILGYGANSPFQLKTKLRRAGFSDEISGEAIAELCRLGYMDEKGDIIKPEVPNVYKFETFIFDAWYYFNEVGALKASYHHAYNKIKAELEEKFIEK